jgi:hypothetical protein
MALGWLGLLALSAFPFVPEYHDGATRLWQGSLLSAPYVRFNAHVGANLEWS